MIFSENIKEPIILSLIHIFLSKLPSNMPVTIVRNKVDLSGETVGLKEENGTTTVCLSAQTHQGVDLLREHLKQVMGFQTGMEGGFLARRRHLAVSYTHLIQQLLELVLPLLLR